MRSSPDRIRARRAVNALAERAADALGTPTASQLDAGLQALWTRETSTRRHRGAWLRRPMIGAMIGAMVAASIGAIFVTGWPLGTLRSWRSSPPLEYRVEGGTVIEGGYLRDA